MTTTTVPVWPPEISQYQEPGWLPRRTDPAAASAALALTIGLLRALKERGVLSPDELDDVLADAGARFTDPAGHRLLDAVRAELQRKDEE